MMRYFIVWILSCLSAGTVAGERGKILDRNGKVLAESKDGKRVYPLKEWSGAHALGYVSSNGDSTEGIVGRSGVEALFEKELAAGADIRMTLDADFQVRVEESFGVERLGAVVVVSPETGEVLALASFPSFDPNQILKADDYKRLVDDASKPVVPRAYAASYPPGSVFKVVTTHAASRAGLGEKKFSSPPSLEIDGKTLVNWTKDHQGMLTLPEALERSSNTVFYRLSRQLMQERMMQSARLFGFGESTGMGLDNESDGSLPDPDKGHRTVGVDLASFSIGGHVTTTPLQVARCFSVIGMRGKPCRLQLVSNEEPKGAESPTKTPEASPDEFSALIDGLTKVVNGEYGTGKKAKVEGVTVAGKTGTAQWKSDRYIAWFAGFAPVEKPKYTVVVAVEGRPGESIYGGKAAAPVAAAILKDLLSAK